MEAEPAQVQLQRIAAIGSPVLSGEQLRELRLEHQGKSKPLAGFCVRQRSRRSWSSSTALIAPAGPTQMLLVMLQTSEPDFYDL
jgi:hypothetical protein